MTLDATDRRILKATASGLPLTPHPFEEVARWLFLPEGEVIARMQREMKQASDAMEYERAGKLRDRKVANLEARLSSDASLRRCPRLRCPGRNRGQLLPAPPGRDRVAAPRTVRFRHRPA